MDQLGKRTANPEVDAPVFEIAFETDDVEGAFQRAVTNGARPVSAPEQMPWGQTVSYVADINGYLVEICSPVSPP
ncbi:Glyoxalase-like domain protein [compost metagenome]